MRFSFFLKQKTIALGFFFVTKKHLMFRSLRNKMGRRALRQWLHSATRQRAAHTLESAKSIGLLFDANHEKTRRDCLEWAKRLEKSGKKVHLLGYFDLPKPPAEAPGFDYFFLKELAFDLRPKSGKAAAFVAQKLDLLLCIDFDAHLAVEWVAAMSPAAMKIGVATEQPNDFDLQLDTPAERGVPFFVEQLERYLVVIKR
jgi:hypothetical protein